jgi:hypothetical protein
MIRAEAARQVRALLPKLGGSPSMAVAVPLGALQALLRCEPVSPTPLADIEVAEVLDHGAKKHAADLTEQSQGPDQERLNRHVAALIRHLHAFSEGQKLDPETGLRTAAHIAARALLACELDLREGD